MTGCTIAKASTAACATGELGAVAGFALGEDRNAPPLLQSAGHLIFHPCSITDISALMVQAAAPTGAEIAYNPWVIAITVTIATFMELLDTSYQHRQRLCFI